MRSSANMSGKLNSAPPWTATSMISRSCLPMWPRTDRDRTVTQSYLTSDTGKVYTMLAHAAGRFN